MKYVVVPPPIQLRDPSTDLPFPNVPSMSLLDWIDNNILSNPAIGQGAHGLRRVIRVQKLFEVAGGQTVAVEETDYAIMMSILQAIDWINPRLASQYYPFVVALETAKEEAPAAAA